MAPVFAPFGTSASTFVSPTALKLVAATPPKVTCVVPVKLFPVIVTDVPTGTAGWVKLLINGTTTNLAVLLAVPPGVVMLIVLLVFAPAGTVAVTCVSDLTVKLAALPPIVTAVVLGEAYSRDRHRSSYYSTRRCETVDLGRNQEAPVARQ